MIDDSVVIKDYKVPTVNEYLNFRKEIKTHAVINPETGFAVVPKDLLSKQGELLWKYIVYPEARPNVNVLSPKEIFAMVFDAGFKVRTITGDSILHSAIEKRNLNTKTGKDDFFTSYIINDLIERGTAKQLLAKNHEGITSLDIAIQNNDKSAAAIVIKDGMTTKNFLAAGTAGIPFERAIFHKQGDIVAYMASKMSKEQLNPYKGRIKKQFGCTTEDLILNSVSKHMPDSIQQYMPKNIEIGKSR